MVRTCIAAIAIAAFATTACSSSNQKTNEVYETYELGESNNQTPLCFEGESCDDGDPCTYPDMCVDGVCVGLDSVECSFECAQTECDGKGGCNIVQVEEGYCLIDGKCYKEGDKSPENQCLVCDPSKSQTEWQFAKTGTPCDDGNPCTEQDYCDQGICFGGTSPDCDDGILCTKDECDPDSGCKHTPMDDMCNDDNPCTVDICSIEDGGCINTPDDSLPCGDGNVCTLNDHCENGKCVHDPELLDCDDGNPCTDEFCHPSYGCVYVFNDNPCDDGADCTINDKCQMGKCYGEEVNNSCPPCNIEFSDYVLRITNVRIGDGGYEGEALNVDGDLKTCAPPGECSEGYDNMLSIAGQVLNDFLQNNFQNAENPIVFLIELCDPDFSGQQEFSVRFYYGDLAQQGCNQLEEVCKYVVGSINFDPLCNPQVSFDNSKIIDGGRLVGGGPGNFIPIKMWFSNGQTAQIVIYKARVEAKLELANGQLQEAHGVFAGAVTQSDLLELIDAIPEQYFPQEQKNLAKAFIQTMPPDIDVNGDNTYDAFSVGLIFDAIPGTILPYVEQ